jgi:hypothetical protein
MGTLISIIFPSPFSRPSIGVEIIVSNHLPSRLLTDDVYKQNDQQDGSNAYSENTHCSVLRPFVCYGRELVSFRAPTVTPPETAAVAIHGPQIQKTVQIIDW